MVNFIARVKLSTIYAVIRQTSSVAWRLAFVFVLTCGSFKFAETAENPASVTLDKSPQGWRILVDGKPYYVKGIACNEANGDHGEDLLKLVADAGANTVRIYGDVTPEYLDRAQRYGLKVNVGYWFNAIRLGIKESYLDASHCKDMKAAALAYVRKFKDHPAVLSWTLGNEVFSFTENENEKEAYGRFLEDLIQAVHKEDPRHPVVYASSYTRDLPYLKRLVPSVDIIGVNVTGGAGPASYWGAKNGWDKPVLVTEFAPLGAWEQRKDPNGKPYDAFDQMKAENYISSWRQIQENSKNCVGGFAFLLGGFRNQDSLTWYNMNYGGLKRAGYWTIYELYTGLKPANKPPKISSLQVAPIAHVKADERTTVSVEAVDPEGDALTYDYLITNIASDPLIVEKPIFYPTLPQILKPGTASVKVPHAPGIYRIYATVTDGHGNIAIADRTVEVVAP